MALRAIYYDTETTGIRTDQDRIVEIAAYDPLNDAHFCEFVNPGIPIPQEATTIHGITNEMVATAPPFAEVALRFIAFCGSDCVLIAHNNDQFDKPLLFSEGKRHEVALPAWPMIDSLKWARSYRPDLPLHNLQFLRQVYGVAENRAHRAQNDVWVLHQIFSTMIDDLPLQTVLQLLYEKPTSSVEAKEPEVMPFGKYQGKPLKEVPKSYLLWLKQQGAFDKPENLLLKAAFEKLEKT